MKLENLQNLESLLTGLLGLEFKPSTQIKIERCLKDVKEAINYSHCCKSDSEQLKCEHNYGQLKDGIYTCFDCGYKEEW